MLYQGKEIEIQLKKSVFGKQVAEVKILSTSEVKPVPVSELPQVMKGLDTCHMRLQNKE